MSAPTLPAAAWFKSSYSSTGNECVEVNTTTGSVVGIRDSKDTDRRPFTVGPDAFRTLVEAVRADSL
ncbi:DUF397 domain-containing protein [Streptomyces sp. NPDC092046]|uniref:DUF397 domain-containing protein n=1 Tax=Streptomyces sp. NPDC092046 TaxID=3366009 RepID=UPI00382CA42C